LNTHHKTKEQLEQELAEIDAAKADPDRFSVLYDRYFRSIFVFIYRRVDDEELSADIAQLVFMKAMINIHRYQHKGLPFSAWLFRIALNEVNMHFRKLKKERTVSLEQGSLATLMAEAHESDSEENRKLLMNALARLDEAEMQLVELRFFEDRPFAEVGAIAGITENNAKVKMYRILEKLKKLLKNKF
jgi:RNA polymerase sigma-70 factor (ECF subfamily)